MVLSVDITKDIYCEDIGAYLYALSTCPLAKGYRLDPYCKGSIRESVLISKSGKNRRSITFYDKHKELTQAKHRELRRIINVDDFKRILRAEFRFQRFAELREAFGKSSKFQGVSFKDVIYPKNNPYVLQLKNAIDERIYTNHELLENMSLMDTLKGIRTTSGKSEYWYYYNLYKHFKYDLHQFKAFLKSTSKSYYRDMAKFNRYFPKIYAITQQSSIDIINRILLELTNDGSYVKP
jgi:hypothetical protein